MGWSTAGTISLDPTLGSLVKVCVCVGGGTVPRDGTGLGALLLPPPGAGAARTETRWSCQHKILTHQHQHHAP